MCSSLAPWWWGWLPQTIFIDIDEYETTITKRPNKKSEYWKKGEMCSSKSFMPRLVEMRPAVIQAIATTDPKIFFVMRRCLNARNVACVLSKEIAARLTIDAVGDMVLKGLIVQRSQYIPQNQHSINMLASTNISATAWLITRYMPRFQRLHSFT